VASGGRTPTSTPISRSGASSRSRGTGMASTSETSQGCCRRAADRWPRRARPRPCETRMQAGSAPPAQGCRDRRCRRRTGPRSRLPARLRMEQARRRRYYRRRRLPAFRPAYSTSAPQCAVDENVALVAVAEGPRHLGRVSGPSAHSDTNPDPPATCDWFDIVEVPLDAPEDASFLRAEPAEHTATTSA
jgi:hypothetical protein